MIRIATENDLDAILEIYAPYVLNTTYTFEYTVPEKDAFLQRFRSITTQFPWLVWEEDGKVLGYAYGSAPFERAAYSWCGEVSVYLAPECQRKGVGKKLYAALEYILWQQGYRVIYALITSDNIGSLAFHEKVGYRLAVDMADCGFKFGHWLGVIWMEKRSNAVTFPIDFPCPWRDIVETDENLADILAILCIS